MSQSRPRSVNRVARRDFLLGATAALAVVAHPFKARATGGRAHLRIMATTDVHVALLPHDYFADTPNDTMGLARTASLMRAIRAEAGNAILLDDGDLLQGNPMGDLVASERAPGPDRPHPVVKAMNALGYDASTLGNHEFNYGLEFLDASLASARFPLVSANVVTGTTLGPDPLNDPLRWRPFVILDRELVDADGAKAPIKIAVVGFTPPQIVQWDAAHLSGKVVTRDIVQSARAWVPKAREAGADLVVALVHSGVDTGPATEGMENAAFHVAGIDGVDVVIAGHQHLVFPDRSAKPAFPDGAGVDNASGTLRGKPAVMPGFWGSHLGLVDLLLERAGAGWRVVEHTAEARPIFKRDQGKVVPLVESDQAVVAAVAAEHEATLVHVRRPVGRTSAPLHSFFALVADDPSVQIVADAQIAYVKEMLKGTALAGTPVLSAAAPFKAGGRGGPDYYTDIPVGDIAIRNVTDLYLYPNTIRAVRVTGAGVREWLERSLGIYNRIEPGKADQTLLNPAFPSYNFDVIDGVTYTVDLTRPSRYDLDGKLVEPDARRVLDLRFKGEPIDERADFIVATNNYRAGGGGNFPGLGEKAIVFVGPDTNRDVLLRHIKAAGTVNPSADFNWRFAPIAGASAIFETGPKAAAHVAEVKSLRLEPAGDGQSGFARWRLVFG